MTVTSPPLLSPGPYMMDEAQLSPLTIVILARDEASFIGQALASAQGMCAELLVVVDPRTTDETAVIAGVAGARVERSVFRSFPAQRNRALELARTPWVLFLDADEQISPELQMELCVTLASAQDCNGFWIPRHNRYWGRWLRGGGWYPDRQLRLLRRTKSHYDERRLVHELATVDGPVGYLQGHLLHWNIASWPELRSKQRSYALAEAQTLWRAGRRARVRNLVLQPMREVYRRLVTWHGYRDGVLGLLLAFVMGYFEWVKYVHLAGLAHIPVTGRGHDRYPHVPH